MPLRRNTILSTAFGAALAATVMLLTTSIPSAAEKPAQRPKDSGAENLGDPDYGVCRGTDPDCYHDWGNFDPAADGHRVLVYSRTAGPRHAHLGPALPAGLNPPLTPPTPRRTRSSSWAPKTTSPSTGPRTSPNSPPRRGCSATTRSSS
ncbi:hypothetical protein [Phytohabitans rumicis]|uniref:Uncharacterized protein n=1 Tax=Phytohabitans rumicis TaxID=1076125 RepID=A0A6V8L0B7_9ACTN|nr:hypothetical protein [Phytohabitans rumicis]GFJ87516.1 hypothetical protein Prum_011580 [Phytohabitans rumicis]